MEDIDDIRETCEQQELTSPNGVASVDVYKQLLVIYLIDSDVINAKFLWKRIPEQIKSENVELQNIWKIGQFLWKKKFANVFTAVSSQQWSMVTQPLLTKLLSNLRTRITDLIARAYSIVKIEDTCLLVGLDETQVIELALEKSWEIDMDNKLIKPTQESTSSNVKHAGNTGDISEALMSSLTDYISFLEN